MSDTLQETYSLASPKSRHPLRGKFGAEAKLYGLVLVQFLDKPTAQLEQLSLLYIGSVAAAAAAAGCAASRT